MKNTKKYTGSTISRRRFMKNAVAAGGVALAATQVQAGSEHPIDGPGARSQSAVQDTHIEKILSRCGSEFGNVRQVR